MPAARARIDQQDWRGALGAAAIAARARGGNASNGNVDAGFDLATSLAGAKTFADMFELQTAFWRRQLGALTAQAEEVHALSTKVTADAAEPIKARMAQPNG